MKWDISRKSSIAFGYGLHSQIQALGVYFAQMKNPDGSLSFPNKDLGFTKSHHFVLSHNYLLARNLRLRTEIYYQHLFNVPVSTYDTSVFSALNVMEEFVLDPLINKGKGKNYGIEISLEKYLSNNFYLTFNNSIYRSKYTARDGVERSTRFDGNFISNLIAGKDFVNEKKSKTFGLNIKTTYAGGYRNTPVDLEKSRQAGYTIFDNKNAYSLQNPAYFRTDLRVSMKWNRKKVTSTLSLDIQNVTNRKNIFFRYYDVSIEQWVNSYQTGLIPILNYKIEF
jgi:outer membrane receptor protein involved in Fe transport